MKYNLTTIRRQSRNNGINFCKYYVVYNTETKQIVYDGDWNINKKSHKECAEKFCEKLNNGEIETKIVNYDGTEREEIVWKF